MCTPDYVYIYVVIILCIQQSDTFKTSNVTNKVWNMLE